MEETRIIELKSTSSYWNSAPINRVTKSKLPGNKLCNCGRTISGNKKTCLSCSKKETK